MLVILSKGRLLSNFVIFCDFARYSIFFRMVIIPLEVIIPWKTFEQVYIKQIYEEI